MIDKTGKSKYNMSSFMVMNLANMIIRASNCYRSGQIDSWFYEWKNIKFYIIAELKPNERTKLKEMEVKIQPLIHIHKYREVIPYIEEYLETIQDYIKDKDIGLVEKGDETVFT
jgi:hypothetical protein